MTAWTSVTAGQVRVGDQVRLPSGDELSVTRVDPDHLGITTYLKLVEDTDDRWMCFVLPRDRQVEVVVNASR